MTARHLFLTGEKGVGKSTLIDRLLSRYTGRVGGFRTRRVDTVRPGEATVHLLRVSDGAALDALEGLRGRPALPSGAGLGLGGFLLLGRPAPPGRSRPGGGRTGGAGGGGE